MMTFRIWPRVVSRTAMMSFSTSCQQPSFTMDRSITMPISSAPFSMVAVGNADHGADRQPVAYIALGPGHMGRRDADAGAVILDGLVTEGADLGAGAVHPQQGVIAFFKNFFYIHMGSPFSFCFIIPFFSGIFKYSL